MKKALIFQGKLIEVAAAAFPVTAEMQWLDVALDVTPETHEYNGTAVVLKPARTAAQVKAAKVTEIDAARDKAIGAGFVHLAQTYHTDATFQSQLQAFLLAWQIGVLAPAATVSIRRKDNTIAVFGRVDLTNLTAAMMQHVQGIYASSWAQKDAL